MNRRKHSIRLILLVITLIIGIAVAGALINYRALFEPILALLRDLKR